MKKTVKTVMVLGVLVIWVGLVLGQNSVPEEVKLSPVDAKAKIIKVLASNAKKRIATPYIVKCYMDMTNKENPPSKVIPEMLRGLSQSKYVSQNKVTLKLFTNAKREDALNFLAEIMVANSIDPEPILTKLNFHAVFLYKGYMQNGLVTLSVPGERTELTNWFGTEREYSWVQFDQLIDEMHKPGFALSHSGDYVDFLGLVKLSVSLGLHQYYQEKAKKIEGNNGEPLPVNTDYVVFYYFDTDPQDCPLCQSELEEMLGYFLYDSKLAKDGKITLILFSQNSEHNTREFLETIIARVFYRRGGFERGILPSEEEVVAMLQRVNFSYHSEVKFSDLGIDDEKIKGIPESEIFPMFCVFGLPLDGNVENRKNIFLAIAEKVIWSKIDQIILAKTPKK